MKAIILTLLMLILLLLPCGCATVPEQIMYPCPDLNDTVFFLKSVEDLPTRQNLSRGFSAKVTNCSIKYAKKQLEQSSKRELL